MTSTGCDMHPHPRIQLQPNRAARLGRSPQAYRPAQRPTATRVLRHFRPVRAVRSPAASGPLSFRTGTRFSLANSCTWRHWCPVLWPHAAGPMALPAGTAPLLTLHVKRWFAYRTEAAPVPLDDALPGSAVALALSDRACCCPARPVVTAVIPPGRGHRCPVSLLLCGHHYRVSSAALHAIGADVYDQAGALIPVGEGQMRTQGPTGGLAAGRTLTPGVCPARGTSDGSGGTDGGWGRQSSARRKGRDASR